MRLIDKYEFTNGRAFETYYLSPADTRRFEKPECDVIGLRLVADNLPDTMTIMRPDEALIQARMLIDAVNKVTEGYSISLHEARNGERKEVFQAESKPLSMELMDDLQEADG